MGKKKEKGKEKGKEKEKEKASSQSIENCISEANKSSTVKIEKKKLKN